MVLGMDRFGLAHASLLDHDVPAHSGACLRPLDQQTRLADARANFGRASMEPRRVD